LASLLRVRKRPPRKRRRLADAITGLVRRRGAFPLTPEGIVRVAEQWTALSDRAPEEIEEPLELLCQDLHDHPPTEVGALMISTMLSQSLAARYQVQRAGHRDRLLPSTPPIVVVGWYRTATTFLQSLLTALPGYAAPPMYLLIDPVPGWLSWVRAEFSARVVSAFEPKLALLHRFSASKGEEDWFLMNQHLIADALVIHWSVPSYADWVKRVDRSAAYRHWARALALIEAKMGAGVVAKDPMHMISLDKIADTVPEARLIWTHRDPIESLASYGSLCALQHRLMYGSYSSERVGHVVLDEMDRYLSAGLPARSAVASDRLIDVKYTDLIRDPVGTVADLCRQADLPFSEEAVRTRVVDLKRQRRAAKHAASLAQWGLEENDVRRRLGYYKERWWHD
jgi:hypothetical protein